MFFLLSTTKIPVTHGRIKEWPLSDVLLFSSLFNFILWIWMSPSLWTYLGHIIYYFLTIFFGPQWHSFPSSIHETERNGKNVFHCLFFCSMLCVIVSWHAFFPPPEQKKEKWKKDIFWVFFRQKFKSRVVLVSCFSFYHPISSSQVFCLISTLLLTHKKNVLYFIHMA